jgi:hypothetical protein
VWLEVAAWERLSGLVQDAVADGFGGVVFTVFDLDLPRIGGRPRRRGAARRRLLRARLRRRRDGERASSQQKLHQARRSSCFSDPPRRRDRDATDSLETPHGLGMILGNELGATLGMPGGFGFTHRPDLPVPGCRCRRILARPFAQWRIRSMDSLMVVARGTDSLSTSPRSSSVGSRSSANPGAGPRRRRLRSRLRCGVRWRGRGRRYRRRFYRDHTSR